MNHRIKLLLVGANLWYFGEGMFGPLIALFTEKIGGSILDVSWAWAIYLIVAGFLYIVVGKISDRYNNKESLMILGYIVNTIFTFGYLAVDNMVGLFVVQAGLGVATALATPTWDTLFAKYEDKSKDGYEWGLAGGEAHIITGVAIIVGGYIINFLSFDILFLTMGVIQLLATIYISRLLKK